MPSAPGRRPLASPGSASGSSAEVGEVGAPAGVAARIVALDASEAVLLRRRPLDDAFETHPLLPALAGRDRAFAFNLASTLLRRLGQIDALIDVCLDRPLPARMASVRDLLRLAVAQLVFLRTPAYAAVYTTVDLARRRRAGTHASLINAVLRRLAGEGARRAKTQDAARLNTPDWLWHSWTAAYGEPVARSIAEIHLAEPPLDLTVQPEADLQRLTDALAARRLPTGTLRVWHAGPVTELPGYDEGAWWVQDTAAALPAKLLGDVRGRRVLDLCAAPGGKTAQLAAAGADVVAVDRSPKRVRRVEDNLRRLSLRAETVVADVATWRPPAPADRVILDVPCSATGTIRRHPDILRLKTPAEIPALTKLQARLLAAAAEMLAPDGILVYCVCSLQPEEGERLVDSSIAEGLPLRRAPLGESEARGFEQFLTSVGDLRTLPCQAADCGGLDGFYAARLRRWSADARDA